MGHLVVVDGNVWNRNVVNQAFMEYLINLKTGMIQTLWLLMLALCRFVWKLEKEKVSVSVFLLTDIVDDLRDVGDELVVVRGLAVLPGQVAAAAAEEGVAEALLAALAVVALVVPHARPVAPLRRVVCNENNIINYKHSFISCILWYISLSSETGARTLVYINLVVLPFNVVWA